MEFGQRGPGLSRRAALRQRSTAVRSGLQIDGRARGSAVLARHRGEQRSERIGVRGCRLTGGASRGVMVVMVNAAAVHASPAAGMRTPSGPG